MMLLNEDVRSSSVADAARAPNDTAQFLADCLAGLSQPQKSLPCKWLYDAEGSRLYELICALPEYYPPRSEALLMPSVAQRVAEILPAHAVMVEFGSGASRKTRTILDAVPQIETYVPIDICEPELLQSSASIRSAYPGLAVMPVKADFTRPLRLDPAIASRPLLGFFPGSTIGNFTPDEAEAFLKGARSMLGPDAHFVLGVDLRKDEPTLIAAYDDAAGVTARFNLNLLVRMVRELDCAVDLDAWRHRAVWNDRESRIEMHLVSLRDQEIVLAGRRFAFAEGETIHTENSHKLPRGRIEAMAEASGWLILDRWVSPDPTFAVMLLR